MNAPRLQPGLEPQIQSVDPRASIWVGANAGTGKTKVLTERIVRLLLDGARPSRILCLTFTKAAAAEMRNRLAGLLGRWARLDAPALRAALAGMGLAEADAEILAKARRLFATVLDEPGGIRIMTLHSFCQSLLQRFPLEAGVPPHFDVLDDRRAAELLAGARETLLAGLAEAGPDPADPALAAALAEVAAHAGEAAFSELVDGVVRERGRLAQLIEQAGGLEPYLAATLARFGVDPAETVDGAVADACAEAAFAAADLRRACAALLGGGKADRERGAVLDAWLASPAARAEGFDAYCAAYLTTEGEIRKTLATKGVAAAMADILEVLAAEAARVQAVRRRCNAIRVARATVALVRLGEAVVARYRRRKADEATLDYDDLILAARRLLEKPGVAPWVLYKLDGGLDHVLIDEAQDTNPDQWEIVRLLTGEFFAGLGSHRGPRTLFVVGDVKQSIFSFQRADPRKFAEMHDFFARRIAQAGQSWQPVELITSYRSTPAVLHAVDLVFAHAPAGAGVALAGAAVKHQSARLGQAGLVELWPTVRPEKGREPDPWEIPKDIEGSRPPHLRLARLMAAHMKSLIGRDTLASQGRKVRAGDIMVLVRRRNDFVEALVRELKRGGIAVAGIDRLKLTEHIAVMDLMALGRFLLLPEDDLTLAVVLKGPLVGLDEAQLFDLAHGRAGSLWQALRQRAGETAAYGAAHAFLSALLARADFVTPFELYAALLGAGGGRERILARLGHDAADPIDEFLGLALAFQRDRPPSLQGFLHWLEAGDVEVKRELEHAARDEVRILTVHGAKGLQAPIVYLPDTCQTPNTGKERLLWNDARDFLVWLPRAALADPVAEEVKDAVRRRLGEEYNRLLYVALTRAGDRLYMCGWENGPRRPEASWYQLVHDALAAQARDSLDGLTPQARAQTPLRVPFDFSPLIGADGWAGDGFRLETPQSAPAMAGGEAAPAAAGDAPPGWTRRPAPDEPVPPRPLAPSQGPAEDAVEAGEPPAFSPLPGLRNRFRRGLLIHRLLQLLPDLPAAARPAAARHFLAQPAHGLGPEAQAALAAEILAVLDHPDHAALFGPRSRAEVPLTGLIEGRAGPFAVSGQVDRLVVEPGLVQIVDYKTNRPPPAEPAGVAPLYCRQMAAYRAVLRGIYPDRPVRCLLLWTDGPRLMALPDALLDRHAP